MQQCAMYHHWPPSVYKAWPSERIPTTSQFAFSGPRYSTVPHCCFALLFLMISCHPSNDLMSPLQLVIVYSNSFTTHTHTSPTKIDARRLKMGMAEGVPDSIRPDTLGRANYFGQAVDLASRIEETGELLLSLTDYGCVTSTTVCCRFVLTSNHE